MRAFAIAVPLLAATALAWSPQPSVRVPRGAVAFAPARPFSASSSLRMALDYNDPAVAEEFNRVQTLTYEETEEELNLSGVTAPPTMTEMDLKLMLVELRTMAAGGGDAKRKRPAKFGSKFEEAYWTKPAFGQFYDTVEAAGDHNKENVVKEYVNNPEVASQRYGKDYKRLIKQTEEALNAPPPVNSSTLQFSGFPANMGADACKMTLEALGGIVDFECRESDDFPILVGRVTYDDIETAKAAVAQYNGMDMGMGQAIEMTSA